MAKRVTKKKKAPPKRKAPRDLAGLLGSLDQDALTDVILHLVAGRPELRREAEDLAEEALGTFDVGQLAADVETALTDLDMRTLHGRSGRQRGGYVDPYDEASNMLSEALDPFLRQLEERIRLGRLDEAGRMAAAIVTGLEAVDGSYTTTDHVLGMSPEWAGEASGHVVDLCRKAGVTLPST